MCRSSSMAPFLTSQANADVAQDAGSQSMRSEFSKPCKKVNGNIIDDNVDWGLDQDTLEPIAVIGFSFTFPEDATSAETFWSMMMEGRCVSTEWPQDRLNGSALYHPDPERLSSVCYSQFLASSVVDMPVGSHFWRAFHSTGHRRFRRTVLFNLCH